MKKFIVLNVCIIITAFAFIQGYISSETPVFGATGWENVTTTEELAEAFRYYCKSRDLTIDGSVADGVTKFTTQTFNNLCNRLGLNVTAIQADLKKSTDGNLGVQYLFNSSGIATYNRIFAQFLQDNDLSVGDSVEDKNVYDGKLFTYQGKTVLTWTITRPQAGTYYGWHPLGEGTVSGGQEYAILARGEDFQSSSDIYTAWFNYENKTNSNYAVRVATIDGNSFSFSWASASSLDLTKNVVGYSSSPTSLPVCRVNNVSPYQRLESTYEGGIGVAYSPITNDFYNILYSYNSSNNEYNGRVTNYIEVGEGINAVVYINSPTINNNTYENNTYTTINNEGDTNNYTTDDEPEPGTPSTPSNPSPITPPSDSGGTDGDVTFPLFNFKFPEINWSLGDLSNKFPFSIPFDLVAFFTVLNAEPKAPAIDTVIPLGNFYDWHFQADFSQFDSYAVIIRNVEYISFVVVLIFLTIKFVKG